MRNRVLRAFMIAALSLPTLSAACAEQAQVRETVLPNGLKVLTKEVRAAPVVSFAVWYRVGSRNEQLGKTGLSHLLEHMQFKGTKRFKKGEMDGLIRRNGGISNAATWRDFTYYWTTISSDKLALAMEIEADRMVNSLLDPKEFEAEKTVVLSELDGDQNDADYLIYYELYATAFKAHPYQWPTIGWRADVKSLTRDETYGYYRTHYRPNNATVVVVGDFETEKAISLVKKHFGGIPPGPEPPKVTAVEPVQLGERRAVVRKAGTTARLMAGYHIPELGHPDSYALDVLEIVLGTGRSSRLYKALVVTELATEAWAGSALSSDPDLFIAGATARDGVSIEDVEAALLAEIERVKTDPITDEELQKALNQLEASFIYDNDSVTAQARRLGEFETKRSWRLLDEYLANTRKVTKSDVQRVAQEYLTERNRTVVTFIPEKQTEIKQERTEAVLPHPVEKPAAYRVLGTEGDGSAPSNRQTQQARADQQSETPLLPVRTVLKNGLVVVIYENRSNPTVAVEGSLWAGGMLDPEGKSGAAELTAGLLTKGTTSRTADEIADELDFHAMRLDISASTEYTRFSGYSLSKHLSRLLGLLADVLQHPAFREEEFQKLKAKRLSALRQEEDNPNAVAERAFSGMVFPKGHPYHRLSIEDGMKNLSAVTREDVLRFYESRYGPRGMVLVVVGDVDAEKTIAEIEAQFGGWQAEGGAGRPVIPDTPLQDQSAKRTITMQDKPQAVVMLGHAGGLKRSDPDFYAAMVMNHILGGGGALGSRLGDVIRDDMGLVYEIWSTFGASLGAGAWYAYLGTSPDDIDSAVATLTRQIEAMRDEGATREEVRDAVDFIAGSFPARRLERNNSIAETLHGAEIYDLGLDYVRRYQSLYRAVTLEQVNDAAKKYLHPQNMTLVIAGPQGAQ